MAKLDDDEMKALQEIRTMVGESKAEVARQQSLTKINAKLARIEKLLVVVQV